MAILTWRLSELEKEVLAVLYDADLAMTAESIIARYADTFRGNQPTTDEVHATCNDLAEAGFVSRTKLWGEFAWEALQPADLFDLP